jgi:IclR family KDG regulon transcriptional repressor
VAFERFSGDGSPAGATAARVEAAVQPVESVRRALRVLSCFSTGRPELGVTELARMLGMHKSTIHRLLVTLEAEGFVYQVNSGGYALSWKAFRIGSAATAGEAIREAVLDALRGVVARTGETAHLAVLTEQQVLYVEKVEGSWALRMPSAVGKIVPPHCTALGKVLLAGLDRERAERLIYATEWPKITDHTIVQPRQLLEEVRAVAKRGYAIDHEEIEEGLLCVAGPITDDQGETCAAVSIAGPASRLTRRLDEHIEVVRDACTALSRRLGPEARRLRKMAGANL